MPLDGAFPPVPPTAVLSTARQRSVYTPWSLVRHLSTLTRPLSFELPAVSSLSKNRKEEAMEVRADCDIGRGVDVTPFIKPLTQSLHRDCMHPHCQSCFCRLLFIRQTPSPVLAAGRIAWCCIVVLNALTPTTACMSPLANAASSTYWMTARSAFHRPIFVSPSGLLIFCGVFRLPPPNTAYLGFLHMVKSEGSTQMRHVCGDTSWRWRR